MNLTILLLALQGSGSPGVEITDTVYWDAPGLGGRLTGGAVELRVPDRSAIREVRPSAWAGLTQSFLPVDPAHRVDLVIVGDGYTSAELGTFATRADLIAAQFFVEEPFRTYQSYFSVHRVDVVSNQSGVDNDPTEGILKDTALGMGFWCGGTERLLCVNVTSATQYANNAPDADLILAIANSTKYGGAGYSGSDLATASAGNSSSLEVVLHEFGHALGNLADEYNYGSTPAYTGGEPSSPNTSKLVSADMLTQQLKWWRWLGSNNAAYDGLISTYEGASQHETGIYRPSNNSLMRNLGRPFNAPSAEKIVIEIYKLAKPIDAHSSTSTIYTGTETLSVSPMQPLGHSLQVQWKKDGVAIPGATGPTLDLSTLGVAGCGAQISVTVRDATTLVRDEAARDQWMTQTLVFQVGNGAPSFENYCIGAPNNVGPGARMGHDGTNSRAANDLIVWADRVPKNSFGVFYAGTGETQTPFGNGWRCVAGSTWRFPVVQSNVFGAAEWNVNWSVLPGGGAQAGQTWRFQYWYRTGGGFGFNLSDGLRVRVCP